MALIVEDGTGKSDAQTYASVSQLQTYATGRRASLPNSTLDREALLLKAMDAMQGLDYVGSRATKSQALDWPRRGVRIDSFEYASTEIPKQLLDAQCALAIEAQTTDLLPTIGANAAGAVISRTVGPITTTYADSGRASNRPTVEKAKAHLRPLLRSGGNNIRLVRA